MPGANLTGQALTPKSIAAIANLPSTPGHTRSASAKGYPGTASMYKIDIDAPNALVVVELAGMLSVEEVDDFVATLIHRITQARLSSYAMLIDVSHCPVQSQEMINAMEQKLRLMQRARALAVVTGSSLARLQVRRIFTQPFARFSSTREAGRDWVLFGKEPPPGA